MNAKRIVHLLVSTALMFTPATFAQAITEPTSAAEKNDRDRVVITGRPTRKTLWGFYRQLDEICPRGFPIPRGHSCAELTYDLFDGAGKRMGRCNVPIFRVIAIRNDYLAMTYKHFDCSNPDRWGNQDFAVVPLEEILNPHTKDGTRLKTVSVLGFVKAKELCETAKECVVDLFDHTRQLSFDALCQLWCAGPPKGGNVGHGH